MRGERHIYSAGQTACAPASPLYITLLCLALTMLDGQMNLYLAHHACSGHGVNVPTLLKASNIRTSTPDSLMVALGLPLRHM